MLCIRPAGSTRAACVAARGHLLHQAGRRFTSHAAVCEATVISSVFCNPNVHSQCPPIPVPPRRLPSCQQIIRVTGLPALPEPAWVTHAYTSQLSASTPGCPSSSARRRAIHRPKPPPSPPRGCTQHRQAQLCMSPSSSAGPSSSLYMYSV